MSVKAKETKRFIEWMECIKKEFSDGEVQKELRRFVTADPNPESWKLLYWIVREFQKGSADSPYEIHSRKGDRIKFSISQEKIFLEVIKSETKKTGSIVLEKGQLKIEALSLHGLLKLLPKG